MSTELPTTARMLSMLPRQQFPATVVARAVELRKRGWGYHRIAKALDAEGWPTARGGRWSGTTVRSLLITNAPEVAAQAVQRDDTQRVVNHHLREVITEFDQAIAERSAAAIATEEFDKALAERTTPERTTPDDTTPGPTT